MGKPNRQSFLFPEAYKLKLKPLDFPSKSHLQILHLVVTVADGGGENRTWVCNYCNKRVVGSYIKVKDHLMRLPRHNVEGCSAVSDEVLEAIKKEYEAAEAKKAKLALNARKKVEYVSIPEGSNLIQQKKRKGMAPQGALTSAFNVAQRDVADKEAARMFYASGLPFNFAKSPYFRKYSLTLANSRLAGYVPPSYNRLRTTLLAQEKEHVNRLLQPIKDTWRKKGVSLVFDRWSDRQRRPLINIMAASSRGSIFIKAIDASGNTKDAEYVANLFVQTINDLGEVNVVQIITDNALNYKAVGLTIEAKYPHLASSSCCERNWSTYSMIQSVKRNRLAISRAKDLVFVHCNLRLLSRKSKEYTEGPSKYWDISGDQFDIDGQEMIELAQLSLDEPELEGITFQEVEESEEQMNGDEC
ncbi:hypothetical protein Acr_04g0001500 [Actinidia rufa]|uniref:DUF659 domain-containing protein n=1 Tax=Actinidia rufa TaxID=165716 RepID=A0A7J0EGJ6_9ERIC|nr:hypothetical protein Acr_04g0001500 [Actinidia rufa]